MAWLESHQTLAGHPKTRKLAHLLRIPKPQAIGHLHCLWWWALDYAQDGCLRRYDALDIAVGAEWEGDAEQFVEAMVQAGFIDRDDELRIHDWDDYAGKLIARRKANAERMKTARAEHVPDTSDARASNVQRTQRARVERQNSTVQNSREEDGEEGASAPAKPKRGTQVPDDFPITDALVAWGKDNGFTRRQMELQVESFQDHYRSKGEARKDWTASFRTWMKKARAWGQVEPDTAAGPRRGSMNPADYGYYGTDGLAEFRAKVKAGEIVP